VQLALYRECRPRSFRDIVAQEHVTRTLLNAIAQSRLAHAYLFCGPRGTGKTSTARVLAKALNCPSPKDGEPCGRCEACEAIARGDGVDVIEMDAASNRGIDEIRNLRERVRLAPVAGRHKVYVIDEVHMLTNEAFNALLKTIEEPPANVVFILCTTEAYRVPATILSRCQRFDFHRLPTAAITQHLVEVSAQRGWDVEEAALAAIARSATGSMRDALGILDQCIAYSTGGVRLEDVHRVLGALDPVALAALAEPLLRGDVGEVWQALGQLLAQGRDAREVTRSLAAHLRDVLLYRLAGAGGEATGPLADSPHIISTHASLAGEGALYEAIDSLATLESEMRLAPQPRLMLEARLLRLCGQLTTPGAPPAIRAATPQARAVTDRPASAAPVTSSPATAPKRQQRSAPPAQPASRPAEPEVDLDWASPADDQAPPPSLEDPWDLSLDDVAAASTGYDTPAQQSRDDGPAVAPLNASAARMREAPAPASSIERPTSVQREEVKREPEVEGAAPDEPRLRRAWQAALADLSDKDRGWLDGAAPGWDRGHFCVWLPAGRDDLAKFLDGKEICRDLARGLAAVMGSEPAVRIKARPPGPGLFGDDLGAAPGHGGRDSGAGPFATDAKHVATNTGGRGRSSPGDGGDDALRQAQEMFGAEEVGKGV